MRSCEREVGELLHLAPRRSCPSRPTRPANATMKLRNERSSSQGEPLGFGAQASTPKKPFDAVAAPVQRAVRRHAAQRLRESSGPSSGGTCRLRARCPGAAAGCVVTTSSGLPRSQPRLSRSPKMWQLEHEASPLPEVSDGVVEERPPVDDRRRLGVVQRVRRERRLRGRVDHVHRVVEAREHVEAVVRLVEHEAGRAAAGRDVVRARGRRVEVGLERRVLERRWR